MIAMGSLTLNLDEELLRRARIRALEQGTSVNALVREWLERYAGDDEQRASAEIVELLSRSAANSGPDPWKWNRDELY
jgi:plasmid stability protein